MGLSRLTQTDQSTRCRGWIGRCGWCVDRNAGWKSACGEVGLSGGGYARAGREVMGVGKVTERVRMMVRVEAEHGDPGSRNDLIFLILGDSYVP